MAPGTTSVTDAPHRSRLVVPGRRRTAVLLVAGGVLTGAGGAMHPQGSGSTVEAHLLTMFASPEWPLVHVLLLLGAVASALGFLAARRGRLLGELARPWLLLAAAGWGFGALELVPHLLAAGEAHELAHHEATPVIDVHLVLQVVASPAVGLTGAVLAVVVAAESRSRVAWLLAVAGVLGGVGSALAAPLTLASGDPRFTVLFSFQAGLALWLVGTGIRVAAARTTPGNLRLDR